MRRSTIRFTVIGLLIGLGALALGHRFDEQNRQDLIASGAGSTAQGIQQEDQLNFYLRAQIGGPSLAIAAEGDRLLVGVGPQIYEYIVKDFGPYLHRISPVLPGIVRDIVVEDGAIYVAAGHLVTLSRDEIDNFTIDEERFIPSEHRRVSAIALHGDYVYAATMESELSDRGELFVLSNGPADRFAVLGSQDSGGILRRIEIAGDLGHWLYAFGGASAVDLSEPAKPTRLGVDRQYQDMSAEGDRRVAVWNDQLLYWGAGAPAEAEPSAEITIPGLVGQQVHLHADRVLVAGEHGAVVEVPIDDAGSFGAPSEQEAGDSATSLLYTDLDSSAQFFFSSLADLPALEGFYPSELLRMGAKVRAFRRMEKESFAVIDGPSLWSTGWEPEGSWAPDGIVFVEGGRDPHFRPRVWWHEFGDPTEELMFEGMEETGAYAPTIAGIGDLLLIGSRPGMTQIHDISGPEWLAVPKLVSNIEEPLHEGLVTMRFLENTLYMAQDEIRRIDIGNPAEPRLHEPSHPVSAVRDFELEAERAYVASKDGFGMIDLSAPPLAEQPAGRWLDELDRSIGVEISGDIAFVTGADPQRGLTAVSLSNPEALEIVGQLPGPNGDVSLFSNEVYVAVASTDRIWFIDVSVPERMEIVGEYPIPRYAAEGWGKGHLFPTLDDLQGDSRIPNLPRVYVYEDRLYYTSPMAGILGYSIPPEWAFRPPNTPGPPVDPGIFLPVIKNGDGQQVHN